MADLGTSGKLILAFVTLLIGAVLISSIASEGQDKTTFASTGDESHALDITGATATAVNTTAVYTVTNAPAGWEVQDCPISSVVITNATGGGTLTETIDYTLTASSGSFVLKDTAATDKYIGYTPANTTYVDYRYCSDDYMNSGWGRTVINLVPGFFALAILGASLLLFYSVAKDFNMI